MAKCYEFIYPPHKGLLHNGKSKLRNSNLELYRIIVMLLIVAHHYVVNSGLLEALAETPLDFSSSTMILFGAWGKTGINCFVLITGYFMCRSNFSINKLLKLYIQILFYTLIIYGIFCLTGHEKLSLRSILWNMWPVKSISNDFTSCFLLFYLCIPFLNIFLTALDKKKHAYLLVLSILIFSVLPTVPIIRLSFNYVGWFIILYFIGAYIRNYGLFENFSHSQWGWITIGLILIGSISVLGMVAIYKLGYISIFIPYFFLADSNKILSLCIAVSAFMFFKDLKIPHSRFINAVGGATFVVLLIHANSETMRTWLWRDMVDCIGNYSTDIAVTLGYAIMSVVLIFIVCAGIDWFRGRLVEPQYMKYIEYLLHFITKKCKS